MDGDLGADGTLEAQRLTVAGRLLFTKRFNHISVKALHVQSDRQRVLGAG